MPTIRMARSWCAWQSTSKFDCLPSPDFPIIQRSTCHNTFFIVVFFPLRICVVCTVECSLAKESNMLFFPLIIIIPLDIRYAAYKPRATPPRHNRGYEEGSGRAVCAGGVCGGSGLADPVARTAASRYAKVRRRVQVLQ